MRRRRDDRIQLSLVGRESSLAPAAPDAVLNRSRHSSLQRSLSGSIRRFGQHLIQRQRKPDSRPTKLECDIPHRLFRVRGRKRIYALIAGSRKRSIGVVSSKCEGLHGPIRRCPTRPLLPLRFRDLPDQGGRNRIGRERGFELAQIPLAPLQARPAKLQAPAPIGMSSSSSGWGPARDINRHPIVQLRAQLIRLGRDNRQAA